MKKIIMLLTVCLNFILNASIDLEENTQSYILETKRLTIKEYEHAFNPSIIRWKGKLLMSFRVIPNPLFSFNSQIGLSFLDDHFNPLGTPQILDTQDPKTIIPSRAEDARLIIVGDKLYIVYSDNKDDYVSRGGFRVYVSELQWDNDQFKTVNCDCLRKFEGASPYVREKNWAPFDYQGNLMLAYSLTPHKIFYHQTGCEHCDTIANTNPQVNWQYGELRGGTPALLDGDHYLAFFHSSVDMLTEHSNKRCISHYFMGAYTFSSTPPFEIRAFSPEPIIGKGFYKGEYYKPYWKSVRCVFPCGFIIEGPNIYLSYGRQDHEMWIVKIDKQGLLDSLITPQTKLK